jgi:parallel beta-helix repeat protein
VGFGIVTLSSDFLSICCNFINLAGYDGISINNSLGTLTANNFIFGPVSRGIFLGGTSTYNNICGNQIRGCSNGIYLRDTAHYCLVACNMIMSHTNDAISIINSDYHTIVSNMTSAPGASGANGINISGSDNVLLVGNRCEAVVPDQGFVIDVQGGGVSNTVTASGNLAVGGNTPTGFSAYNNIDGNSCRHI